MKKPKIAICCAYTTSTCSFCIISTSNRKIKIKTSYFAITIIILYNYPRQFILHTANTHTQHIQQNNGHHSHCPFPIQRHRFSGGDPSCMSNLERYDCPPSLLLKGLQPQSMASTLFYEMGGCLICIYMRNLS